MKHRKNKVSVGIVLAGLAAVTLVVVFFGIAVREMFVMRSFSETPQYPDPDVPEISEELYAFEELPGSFRTGHEKVFDFTIDEAGRIYVAGDRLVRIFDKDGTHSGEIALPTRPTAVTVSDERVYVALIDHLVIYNMEGELADRWTAPSENSLLTSIEVYGDEVFLADAGSRFVRRYDNEGNFLGQIGARDEERGVPGIVLPSPCFVVVMGHDGFLRVNNPGRHRIETYTPQGGFVRSWGKASSAIEGFCGCCNPVDFDLLPDGRYVTAEKGLIRVKIYDADGTFESVVAGPEQLAPGSLELLGQRSPDRDLAEFKVAADSDGLIYVLDPGESKVRMFREKEK